MAYGTLYFAGACVPNPGRASVGFVIYDEDGDKIHESGSLVNPDPLTCNAAHYRALIRGLNRALNRGITDIHICGHSLLVINQVREWYEVRNPKLQKYLWIVRDILSKFDSYQVEHIPWEENEEARFLAFECFEW